MPGRAINLRMAVVAALGALALTFALAASRADAYVYWSTPELGKIGRATNEGGSVEPAFISNVENPSGLAVDAGHIYWANFVGESIGRAKIGGTDVEPGFIHLPYRPTGIAVNESHLYWAANGTIGRANLDGTGKEPEFINKNVDFPCGLAIDSGHLYWATGAAGPGFIERAPVSGGTVEYEFVKTGTIAALCGVAVNTTSVFWADNGLGGGTNIGRANLSNGEGVDQSFIGQAHGPCGLTIFGSKLYWPNSGTSTIARANTDSTAPEYEWIQTGAPVKAICGIAIDNLTPPPPTPKGPDGGGGGGSGGSNPWAPAPDTKIRSGPGSKLAEGRASFSFTADQAGPTFQCKLDGKKIASCRSPKRYSGLKPGKHAFKVWATNGAGAKDATPAKKSFSVPGAPRSPSPGRAA